jgi:hypothetical protein
MDCIALRHTHGFAMNCSNATEAARMQRNRFRPAGPPHRGQPDFAQTGSGERDRHAKLPSGNLAPVTQDLATQGVQRKSGARLRHGSTLGNTCPGRVGSVSVQIAVQIGHTPWCWCYPANQPFEPCRDCQIATGSAAAAGGPRRAAGAKAARHPEASATPSRTVQRFRIALRECVAKPTHDSHQGLPG